MMKMKWDTISNGGRCCTDKDNKRPRKFGINVKNKDNDDEKIEMKAKSLHAPLNLI